MDRLPRVESIHQSYGDTLHHLDNLRHSDFTRKVLLPIEHVCSSSMPPMTQSLHQASKPRGGFEGWDARPRCSGRSHVRGSHGSMYLIW